MKKIITISMLAALLFLGCAGRPQRAVTYDRLPEKPGKSSAEVKAGYIPEYRLGFGDVIEVKFFNSSEFNETITVRPDGRISLSKVGEIQVTGMTPLELDSIITKTFEEFILEPEITVIVREFGGQQVFVLGQVEKPGGYAINREMTVLQALAVAGGANVSAKLNSVMVLRKNRKAEIEAIKIDLTKFLTTKSFSGLTENQLVVQSHDIVYVPKTKFASASEFMRKIYSGFLPPLDLYLRAVFYYDRN